MTYFILSAYLPGAFAPIVVATSDEVSIMKM